MHRDNKKNGKQNCGHQNDGNTIDDCNIFSSNLKFGQSRHSFFFYVIPLFWECSANLIRNTNFEETTSRNRNIYLIGGTTALGSLPSLSLIGML